EIINQKIDLKGEISIDILSTGFSVTGNFGVFSPSSLVSSGATTKKIPLKEINNLDEQIRERDKWNSLIGCKLNVRSEDYSYFETTTLLGLDIQDLNTITVDTLSVSAPIDAIVELADYDEQPLVTTDIGKYIRLKYTFTMFQDTIAAVAGDSVFEVADGGIYFNGMDIAVHSNDYTRDQPRATISTVVGNIITLTSDLDFTPQVGDKIEQLEFLDYDGYLFL
ncbi:MAG: hypothetical protein KDH96_08505, partial [Candidatus Riesia sp.]|nr:hypothetical protein [Candidatus Riesia sp.]